MSTGLGTVVEEPADHPAPGSPADVPARSGGLSPRRLTGAALTGLLVLMVRVTVHAGDPLDNGDTWFHLRIGHLLWGPWSIAHPGRLSSFATSPWVPTQWSTEMVAAKVEDWFGLPGVAWLFGALFLAFVTALYALCRRESSPLAAVVCTGVAVIAAAPALSARPQVVTLVLLALVVGLWLRAARDLTVPWVLVPVTWVWATAHGMWSVGVVAGAVAVTGLLLDRRLDRRLFWRMAAVPVGSVVAACLTPIGPRLLTSQLAVGARSSLIAEWQATSFRTLPAFLVAVMVAVVVMRWTRARGASWTRLLLLLCAAGWAALVTRMVGCSAVVVAPILAGALQEMLDRSAPRSPVSRGEKAAVASIVAVCLAGLALAVPHTAQRPGGVPDRFVPELSALPSGTVVAVEDHTGAWIEWRFPGLDPMIDGMLDAYPVSYIAAFGDYRTLQPGWQDFWARSHARAAVLVKGSALTAAVQDQLGWRAVDRDAQWVYLVPPDAAR